MKKPKKEVSNNEILEAITELGQATAVSFGKVDERLDSVDDRLDSVDERLDSIDNHLESLDTRVGIIEGSLISDKKRLERIETKIGIER